MPVGSRLKVTEGMKNYYAFNIRKFEEEFMELRVIRTNDYYILQSVL